VAFDSWLHLIISEIDLDWQARDWQPEEAGKTEHMQAADSESELKQIIDPSMKTPLVRHYYGLVSGSN
jgi:hypothetical protein